VLIKEKVVRALCPPLPPGWPIPPEGGTETITTVISVGADRYCATCGGQRVGNAERHFKHNDCPEGTCPGGGAFPSCSECGSCAIPSCVQHCTPAAESICVNLGMCSGTCSSDAGCPSGRACVALSVGACAAATAQCCAGCF
jgi:hypothetical protein